jgi:hypothetical protein
VGGLVGIGLAKNTSNKTVPDKSAIGFQSALQ